MTNVPAPRGLPQAAAEESARWNESAHGRGLSAVARVEVGRVVPELFGRHFLQIGEWDRDHDWLAGSAMLHRSVLGVAPSRHAHCRVDPAALPFAARSIDAVLLPHTLETVGSAHTLLREVARVLSDRGHLVMVGFDPWGFLAWRRRLGLAPKAMPVASTLYSPGRVGDWLTLLDFEVTSLRRFGFGFPWTAASEQRGGLGLHALLSRFSDAYIIHARKRVTPMTFIGRTASPPVRNLVPVPIAGRISPIHRSQDPDA